MIFIRGVWQMPLMNQIWGGAPSKYAPDEIQNNMFLPLMKKNPGHASGRTNSIKFY